MCQSHTGRLTGLWFLPKPAFGLNTTDDDIYIYIYKTYSSPFRLHRHAAAIARTNGQTLEMLIKPRLLLSPSEIQDVTSTINFISIIFFNYFFCLSSSPPLSVFSQLRFSKSSRYKVWGNKYHEFKIKHSEFLTVHIRHSGFQAFMNPIRSIIRYSESHTFNNKIFRIPQFNNKIFRIPHVQ